MTSQLGPNALLFGVCASTPAAKAAVSSLPSVVRISTAGGKLALVSW